MTHCREMSHRCAQLVGFHFIPDGVKLSNQIRHHLGFIKRQIYNTYICCGPGDSPRNTLYTSETKYFGGCVFCFAFPPRGFLYKSPGCSWSHFVDQVDLELVWMPLLLYSMFSRHTHIHFCNVSISLWKTTGVIWVVLFLFFAIVFLKSGFFSLKNKFQLH